MNSNQTRVHKFTADGRSLQGFRKAVSLHCHTQHSKENLSFIPHFASRIPVVNRLFQAEVDRRIKRGKNVDFSSAYWTPPISARGLFESEAEQIERQVGLEALVSITDHDSIEACQLLEALDPFSNIPVSLEWTVPFGAGFFHIGVHNLPPKRSTDIMSQLSAYTFNPKENSLSELLGMLNELPETLLVLNHPAWDIEFAGPEQHAKSLSAFMAEYGRSIHAFELNGTRPWRENNLVLRAAEELELPVVSGGDRHSRRPNCVLNLTPAGAFSEFASEVRYDRRSEILLLPEYGRQTAARQIEEAADIVRFYPHYPCGQQRWTDRVFVCADERGVLPLSLYAPNHWKGGGPRWLRHTLGAVSLLGSRPLQPVMRLACFLLAPDREVVALLGTRNCTQSPLASPTTINRTRPDVAMGTVEEMLLPQRKVVDTVPVVK